MARVILTDAENRVAIYRADKLDVNGNPRHIVHFLDFLTKEEQEKYTILEGYELAVSKAKKFGHWRRYTNREFGGGLITQGDYCGGRETLKRVLQIRNSSK